MTKKVYNHLFMTRSGGFVLPDCDDHMSHPFQGQSDR